MKNLCEKTRKTENPYEIWVGHGFEYRVLKKWQADDDKPYARWFLATKSPYTFGTWELGDRYVAEVKANARKLSEEEMIERLKDEAQTR